VLGLWIPSGLDGALREAAQFVEAAR
jgi:hypothetical protein